MPGANDSKPVPARTWWGRQRLRYNLALLAAGVLAFACFVLVFWWSDSVFPLGGAESSARAVLREWSPFAAAALVIFLLIANVCYFAGPLLERIIPLSYVGTYRRVAFRLGLWLSVLVPFAIPGLLAGLLLLCSLAGYGKPVRLSDLPGTYVADYGFATDTLTLARDGSYVQTVKVRATGKVAVGKGRWYADSDSGARYVVIEDPMEVLAFGGESLNPDYARQPPNTIAQLQARWLLGRLELGGDDIPWGRTGAEIPYTKRPGR